MLARNHLIVNAAVAAAVGGVSLWALGGAHPGAAGSSCPGWWSPEQGCSFRDLLASAVLASLRWLGAPWHPGVALEVGALTWLAAALALYWLGSLVPDIDNPRSLLGRWFAWLPMGPHRGITHTLYPALVLVLLVAVAPALRVGVFFLAGMLLHLLADAPSRAGWVPWWPLSFHRRGWRLVGSDGGSMVVTDAGPKLYTVGRPSEAVVVAALVVPLLAVAGWAVWEVLGHSLTGVAA